MKYAKYGLALAVVFNFASAHAATLTRQQILEVAHQFGETAENFGRCKEVYLKNDPTVDLDSAEDDFDWVLDKMLFPVVEQGVMNKIITIEEYESGMNAGTAFARANQLKVEREKGLAVVQKICQDDIKNMKKFREGFQ